MAPDASYPIEIRAGKGNRLSGEYLFFFIIGLFGVLMAWIVRESFKPSSFLDASAIISFTMTVFGLGVAVISATRLVDRTRKIIFERDSLQVYGGGASGRYAFGFVGGFIALLIAEGFMSGVRDSWISISAVALCAIISVACGMGFFFKRTPLEFSLKWTEIASFDVRSCEIQKNRNAIDAVGLVLRGDALSRKFVRVSGLDRSADELILLFQRHISGVSLPSSNAQVEAKLPIEIRFDRRVAWLSMVGHMVLILCLPSSLLFIWTAQRVRGGGAHTTIDWLGILVGLYGFFSAVTLFGSLIKHPRDTIRAFRWDEVAWSWQKARERRPQVILDKQGLHWRLRDQVYSFAWSDLAGIELSQKTKGGSVEGASLKLRMRGSNEVTEIPAIDLEKDPETIYRLSCHLQQSVLPHVSSCAGLSPQVHFRSRREFDGVQ